MPETAVLALVATGLAVGAVSAVSPFLPVEAYVGGVALTQPPAVAVAVATAAGLGQTLGKTALFASTRTAGRSPRLQRLLRRRTHAAMTTTSPDSHVTTASETTTRRARARAGLRRLNTNALAHLGGPAGPVVVLLSACLGAPPLLLVTLYAGASPMTYRAFVPTCLLGRTARFCVIALLPGLVRA